MPNFGWWPDMGINIVDKGKEGEREIVRLLSIVIERVIADGCYDEQTVSLLRAAPQRNQNQSAVGGADIQLFGISFEVKRQETLSVNTWWKQCTDSARRNEDMPILIYRQNRKAWNVVMMAHLYVAPTQHLPARVETDIDTFEKWFFHWVKACVASGYLDRV